MTVSLFYAATATTLADIAAYLLLVVPGRAAETNPVVADMTTSDAVAARLAVLVALGSLTVLADHLDRPGLTIVVNLTLAVALVVGLLGAVFTVAAAS